METNKEKKVKLKRYLLFTGDENLINLKGNTQDESFYGDYASVSDAYLETAFIQLTEPNVMFYIFDNKIKDLDSYRYGFKG